MKYTVPVIPGDGIGPEIVAEGCKVLEAAAEKYNFSLDWKEYSLGAEHYLKTGELVAEETLKELSKYRALFLGAIGDPRVRPGILEKGVLLTMRFYFDQYVNLRPVKLLEGVWTPLKDKSPKDIDFVVVRESTDDTHRILPPPATAGRAAIMASSNSSWNADSSDTISDSVYCRT